MDTQAINWCMEKGGILEITTAKEAKDARNGDFFTLCMYALDHYVGAGRTPHTQYSALHIIYSDLMRAWFITNHARPITMQSKTLGQWMRWYERTVMPAWS